MKNKGKRNLRSRVGSVTSPAQAFRMVEGVMVNIGYDLGGRVVDCEADLRWSIHSHGVSVMFFPRGFNLGLVFASACVSWGDIRF
jgi:hypothetical protein